MEKDSLRLVSGTSHPQLAKDIAKHLNIPLSDMIHKRFANNEIYSKPKETVRGKDVFVVQSSGEHVNEDIMELFIMLDSLKRSFAKQIHVVIPHFPYSRQDRSASAREPISAKLIADLISKAGANHIITLKLHSGQEQGFFDIPVDNLNPNFLFAKYFKKKKLKNPVVVSPDTGGTKDAKKFADLLSGELAIIHKSRPKHNVAEVHHVIGNVKGKTCILYDDMIDTGGSITKAAEVLRKMGVQKNIYAAATHPILSPPATKELQKAKLKEVIVTDSIPIPKKRQFPQLKTLSIAPFLAHIIQRVHKDKSVTALYEQE